MTSGNTMFLSDRMDSTIKLEKLKTLDRTASQIPRYSVVEKLHLY